MGKGRSPGKWIKNLLLGKKSSSKSTSSKKNNIFKPSTDKNALVSSEISVSDPTVDSLLISAPISGANDTKELLSEREVVSRSSHDKGILSTGDEEAKGERVSNFGSQEDLEKLQLTEAAIIVQAAYRSYLARQTFQRLKAVIQLQALVRGHLVRRQAVSALYCVKGIVKFQALIRGYSVRRSDIGLAVQNIRKDQCSNSHRVISSTQAEKLSENVFVCKLLASSPYAVPLSLNGDPREPNMAWKWLDYWTLSHFWGPLPEFKMKLDSVSDEKNGSSQIVQRGQVKKNTRKSPSVKVDNRTGLGTNKSKQRSRKDSSYQLPSAQERPQKETEKGSVEKTHAHNVSNESEVNEKRKSNNKKIVDHAATDVSSEKMKDSIVSKSKVSNPENGHGQHTKDKNDHEPDNDSIAVFNTSVKKVENGKLQGVNEDLNGGDNCISNNCQRRASLPANFNDQDNELYNTPVTPRLPSYMATTESAKAKLRGQGSPRFATDLVDKNSTTRRHSLSSSLNGRSGSFSPRAERLMAMTGRGGIRSDRSLSSSRDGTEKLIQPQWRR